MAFGLDDAAMAIDMAAKVAQPFTSGNQNRKNRDWNERMYERQKYDNRYNWHMQNAYNSPEQQMERLKQAGLNPNLVYGNGVNQSASSIDKAQTLAPQQQPIQIPNNIGMGTLQYKQSLNALSLSNGYQELQDAEIQNKWAELAQKEEQWYSMYLDNQAKAEENGVLFDRNTPEGGNSPYSLWKAGLIAKQQGHVVDLNTKNETLDQERINTELMGIYRDIQDETKQSQIDIKLNEAFIKANEKLNSDIETTLNQWMNAEGKLKEQLLLKLETQKMERDILYEQWNYRGWNENPFWKAGVQIGGDVIKARAGGYGNMQTITTKKGGTTTTTTKRRP